jgi:hypothetical protein
MTGPPVGVQLGQQLPRGLGEILGMGKHPSLIPCGQRFARLVRGML